MKNKGYYMIGVKVVSIQNRILKEPELFFKNGNSLIHPKVGLMKYGPYGGITEGQEKIKAGVISTYEYYEKLKWWLKKLESPIEGKDVSGSKIRSIQFPGLSEESPIGFELEIQNDAVELISKEKLNEALGEKSRKERIKNIFELYEGKFSNLSMVHSPDIVLLPIDERIINKCSDPRNKHDMIKYERRSFDKSKYYFDPPFFDFHNALKVVAADYGMTTQLIKPKTLDFSDDLQHPSTIAWNFSVGIYYKGTGYPWKLADIEENTCYVGISFYQDISEHKKNLRTALAHVYLKTGESQIIRGKSFTWDESDNRSPVVPKDHAAVIMNKVISLYKEQKNKNPSRIVVHKSSPFNEEEINGFNRACSDIELADYVHISTNTQVQGYMKGHNYPVIRGTMFGKKNRYYLYTTGYVPCLDTYPGATVPNPIVVRLARNDTTPYKIGKDILALTKLDWNTADFCKRRPVTISVSKKVGDILAEMKLRGIENPPEGYMYYM